VKVSITVAELAAACIAGFSFTKQSTRRVGTRAHLPVKPCDSLIFEWGLTVAGERHLWRSMCSAVLIRWWKNGAQDPNCLEWDQRRRALSSSRPVVTASLACLQVDISYIGGSVVNSSAPPIRFKAWSIPWRQPPARPVPWCAPEACARAPWSSCARPSSASPAGPAPARLLAPGPALAASCRPATSRPLPRANAQPSEPPPGP
jgi:hypothetical protein